MMNVLKVPYSAHFPIFTFHQNTGLRLLVKTFFEADKDKKQPTPGCGAVTILGGEISDLCVEIKNCVLYLTFS